MTYYRLCDVTRDEEVLVKEVNVHGSMKRRLVDIGLIEGTRVKCVGKSPLGDPSAYLIRGAVIAIREETGKDVTVERVD